MGVEPARPFPSGRVDPPPEPGSRASARADLVAEHYAFIWRCLRRLGVAEQGVDDATQQVFVLAAEKADRILPGRERPFLFQTAVRVAMSVRRDFSRRREAWLGDDLDAIVDPSPLPDEAAEERRRRLYLDVVLDELAMDLRTVFVLYEIEGMDSPAIASMLQIPVGTVASRLRRGREAFRMAAERLRKRLAAPRERSDGGGSPLGKRRIFG
jgi:RNA polymerase sigma-70 factor (ECF subfamily)